MKKLLTTILIAVFLLTGGFDAYASIELYDYSLFSDADLVSYYRLEGNSNDSKDSNNGTDTNMTYGTSYGLFDQGGDFNGSSGKISLGNPANLKFATTTTINFWVRPDGTSGTRELIDRTYNNTYSIRQQDNYFIAYMYYGGSPVYCTTLATQTITAGNWYMVTFTWNKPGSNPNATLYINGVSKCTMHQATAPANTTNITIGDSTDASSEYYDGSMDDISFFGRALTATEVLDYYNASGASRRRLIITD